MKQKLRFIALFLVAVMLCTALASCKELADIEDTNDSSIQGSGSKETNKNSGKVTDKNNKNDKTDSNDSADKNDNASNNDSSSSSGSEKLPDNIYLLFQDGKYKVNVVFPDNPTDTEKTVYSKLRSTIKAKTGVTVQTTTDYLKTGETHSKNEYAILVGYTNYDESRKAYTTTDNGTYGIKFYDKKIVFYFSTEDEGLSLVSAFGSAIKSNSDKAFWISKSFSVAKKTTFKTESIPSYPSSTKSYNCYDDTTMLIANNTNLNTYNSYCSTLKSNGFVEYSKRDDINGNYYRTYTKGTMALTVYFTKSTSTVRIISGPLSDIPTKDIDRTSDTTNKNPTITMLSQGAAKGSGLGIIYHLPNGKFFVYDGGYVLDDNLYKTLKSLAGNNEIVIAAWIISHPHPDHQDSFDNFITKHYNDIRIENVLYNFTNAKDTYGTSETIKASIEKLNRTTNIIKPHTGQVYNFGSSSIEILYTVEDFMPRSVSDLNYSTMVVRFTVKGQTMIALGDAYKDLAPDLTNMYGSHLKSDMVQLAHHGTTPGTTTLYEKINAPILFWPSCASNATTRYKSSDHESLRKAISLAKDVYLAGDGTVTIAVPCKIVNNKSSFLNRMGLS